MHVQNCTFVTLIATLGQMFLKSAAHLSRFVLRSSCSTRRVRKTPVHRTMATLQKTSYGDNERIPGFIGGPSDRPAVIVLQVSQIAIP